MVKTSGVKATLQECFDGLPLLQVVSLEKYYNRFHAIKGLSFHLEENTYVSLLGPSGCGKTTILRIIAGFENANSGRIELDGDSLIKAPAYLRPVNTVFQNYALFPHMTVSQNIAFGLAYTNLSKKQIQQRTKEALAVVRMEQMAERLPVQLSGGQQQRVALARAIINEPRLLLLDEPLSALDRRMRKDMQIELKDLQKRLGMTFLHVTHDQEEAFALSDQIIVMNHGKIEQQGTPEEIYQRPDNAYVADFIGGANQIEGHILKRQGALATIQSPLGNFCAPCVSTIEKGEVGTLCIRPEQFKLEGGDNHLKLTVTHRIFRGADWQIEARAVDGSLIHLIFSSNIPQSGSEISVCFDPSSAWIAAGSSKK